MHLRAAVYDSLLQFLQFKTGDGIEPQLSASWSPNFSRIIPEPAARLSGGAPAARPDPLQDPEPDPCAGGGDVGAGPVPAAPACRRAPGWGEASLPALVLLGLIGNAIICGTFSNPHDRYQSRVIWLPTLVLLLAVARDRARVAAGPGIRHLTAWPSPS